MPTLAGELRLIYLAGALLLDAMFVLRACALRASRCPRLAMRAFRFSINYLLLLFGMLLLDHYCVALQKFGPFVLLS